MPDWILLLPLLFPLTAAPLLAPIANRVSARARLGLAVAFLAIEILTILANALPGSHRFAVSTWDATSFSIALQCDGVALLLLLMIFVPLAALWLIASPHVPFDLTAILVLTAAMLLTMADGLITIYLAWVALDLAIFAWWLACDVERATAIHALALSQLAGLMLFAGALLLGTARANDGALLLTLAFWARLGLFPLHATLPTRGVQAHDLWIACGVPLLAASSLWLRWSTLRIAAPGTMLSVLAGAAFIAAIIWTWSEEHPTRVVTAGVSHAFALAPLAIAFGSGDALAFALWLALGATAAIALFAMAQTWRAENRNRYPRLIWFAGVLALSGLPLTPTFLARVGLYVTLWENGEWLLLVLAGAATTLILAPLWNFGFALTGTEARESNSGEYAGLAIIVAACGVLSLAPLPLAHALAANLGESADHAMERVIWTNDALGVVIGFAMAILPVVASFFLRGAARAMRSRPKSLLQHAARMMDLAWLRRILTGMGYRTGAMVRNVQTIAEENPTVWLLFIALWIAIFIAMAR